MKHSTDLSLSNPDIPITTPPEAEQPNAAPSPDVPLAPASVPEEPARNRRRMPRYAGVGPERGSQKKRDPAQNLAQASSLGSLEAELMGLLWELGRPASGMDVMEASLYKRRSAGLEPIAFASIATTLRRLSDKGLLRAEKGEQRTPLYTPTVEREQMAARILNNVSMTLLGHSLRNLLPRLMGTVPQVARASSPEEQEQVARLMQAIEEAAADTQPVETSDPAA